MNKIGSGRRPLKKVIFYIVILVTCVLAIFPGYWLLITSITERSQILNRNGLFPPLDAITFSSYSRILTERPLVKWFSNSILVTVLTILLVVVVSSLAAYSLSRFRSRWNRLIGYSLLLVCMMPATLFIVPLYIMFMKMGLINSFLSVVLANTAITIPFSTWMMKGFFDGISPTLEEAAEIDGCGTLSSFIRIILPLSLPGIATNVIYVAVLAWSDFLFARTFLSQDANWTMTVGVYSMIGEHQIMWEEISAVSLISIVPITILFMFFQKYLINGMAAGAVKQ